MSTQLTLDLTLPVLASFDNFIEGANKKMVDLLRHDFLHSNEPYIYLWSGQSTGKSHLLQACCQVLRAQHARVFYLDIELFKHLPPDILMGLEHHDLISIDNIQLASGCCAWEEGLFHLYNRCREHGTRLLMAGAVAPALLGLQLADLSSRLSSGLIWHVEALSDAEKIVCLQRRMYDKGMRLSPEAGNYILSHYARDMKKLMQLVDVLDKQSLIEQRRITVPFLKNMISSMMSF